ncbi:family 10 glycosylhydrolase [Psychrobacillus sp. INOP01]|uniref:family 10 glycosylhydrolase n=1 Tax=Psychrobacillus sp. INOP01 TaxID=2829187 RepID=UPI001BABEB99|nr:family 10 glycosylhydrolase [Psychrobacillus sp. INOP01]QUG40214.1 family 10 glycosylhydrolase [Psychrobacillus sp. INOP01]
MKYYRQISLLVSLLLIIGLLPISISAEVSGDDFIEVEAAPVDPTISVEGPRHEIDFIDESIEGKSDFIALYTEEFASEILVKKFWVAVQVDQNNQVLRVVSQSNSGSAPIWEDEQFLAVPEGGYILLAHDDSWGTKNFRKYLATNFKANDIIKLRKNGEVVPISEFMKGDGLLAGIQLNNELMYTVTEQQTDISGSIKNFEVDQTYQLKANGKEIGLAADGTFSFTQIVDIGTNYIDLEIYKNDRLHETQSLIVYYKETQTEEKKVFLWIEQGPNVRRFQSSEDVYNMLVEAKDAGVTAIALDVKGVEGFAAYKENDLTGRPYVSEMTSPARAGSNPNLDILEEFITHSHSLGLEVHAAINVFAEGSIAHNEYAVLNDHLDWEEEVYRYEDSGEILRLRESDYGKSGALVAFVNPANSEAREYQLDTFEEVIKNYDVDGVLLDRGRYDNYFADFSDESKVQFEAYLKGKGKELTNWPEDVFTYNGSDRIDGPLIDEWFTYRSSVIKSFTSEVRELVDSYNVTEDRDVLLSSYVGSWYESYYLNGVNWASPTFEYNERMKFPHESLYTEEYANTGYTENLDFLMIGTYQTTANEVKKYITQGNILTDGKLPLYAGMALVNVQEPAVQREVFQAGLANTDGLMLFDYSQANFPVIKASINNELYLKDYQLGVSNPKDSSSFIEGDFLNINRNDGNINIYSNTFGPSTATNKWGVEAVVDESGQVVKMVNKRQAMEWSWGSQEDNNSLIPEGGFVISAQDPSGSREKRQTVAFAYDIGDEVRAALLSGFLDYEGQTFNNLSVDFNGSVQVVGTGEAEVTVNGTDAVLDENGDFSSNVELQPGTNEIEVVVHVDGHKTHYKVVEVFAEEVTLDVVREAIEVADINPNGIKNAILAQLDNAARDFKKAAEYMDRGEEEQAVKHQENGNKKLEKIMGIIEQHAGKHIDKDDAAELIRMLELVLSK